MIIQLTNDEVIKMGKLAILASRPVGMGILHHQPDLREEDIQLDLKPSGSLSIDYYSGRMVKFYAHNNGDGNWEFHDTIRGDYQSWISKYASYEELAKAARG